MNGLHLMADLSGCSPDLPLMTSLDALRAVCQQAVQRAGLVAVAERFHAFVDPQTAHTALPDAALGSNDAVPQSGITGVVLLAESHLAIHTWPELGAVTLDLYVCNRGADHSGQARQLLADLIPLFQASASQLHEIERGSLQGDSPAFPAEHYSA